MRGTAAATLTLSAVGITSELAQGPTSALTPSSSISELAASWARSGSVLVSFWTSFTVSPLSPAAALTWSAAS